VARKKKELPLLEKVTIMDVAAEGKAIAKVNDLVIFVPYVVPGDVVDLQIKRKKNKYAEAEAVKFHMMTHLTPWLFWKTKFVCWPEGKSKSSSGHVEKQNIQWYYKELFIDKHWILCYHER